ncbi:MAG: hypothetical protein K2N94_02230 [Lachnospiraceae bacterium]|nr:hypothetical protein [Lachnospiraceae bacterium]
MNDTVALLKECNSGIRMGIQSLEEVIDRVSEESMRSILHEAKQEHEELGDETHSMLISYHEDGKEPHLMAKMMSAVKTGTKLALEESDQTVANLITDGCDMGIKSLHKYLNQYSEADEKARKLTARLIDAEEKLRKGMQDYL